MEDVTKYVAERDAIYKKIALLEEQISQLTKEAKKIEEKLYEYDCICPTKKIIHNDCYGGWKLSEMAIEMLIDLGEDPKRFEGNLIFGPSPECRTNKNLVHVIETLGEKANGKGSKFIITEYPIYQGFKISNYDGLETILYSSICKDEAYLDWRSSLQ